MRLRKLRSSTARSDLGAKFEAMREKETRPKLAPTQEYESEEIRKSLKQMVARGGIEPPTRGFSVRLSTVGIG